jgi:hypothetical protein
MLQKHISLRNLVVRCFYSEISSIKEMLSLLFQLHRSSLRRLSCLSSNPVQFREIFEDLQCRNAGILAARVCSKLRGLF